MQKYLDHSDPEIATKSQFFIARICKEIIEQKLQTPLTPFPQKILLQESEKFETLAQDLLSLDPENQELVFQAQNLKSPTIKSTRWIEYNPQRGNLQFGYWHPEDWRKLKTKLECFKKIIGYRHEIQGEAFPFFRIFFGITQAEIFKLPELFSQKIIEVPPDLISQNSPEFNAFCQKKIIETLNQTEGNIAINFSSLETLKNIFFSSTKEIDKNSITAVGERASGGQGKVLEILEKSNKKKCLFYQKMSHPKLGQLNCEQIILQKFPFPAPHPLLEKIEQVMKHSGQNFWDLWTIPQIAADLSRRISLFPSSKKIIILDPRENANWGKGLLKCGIKDFIKNL